MAEWKPHSHKQNAATFSEKPIVVCATGIQWGKSSVGAIRMKMAMHQHTDPTDNFLIVAPTYKIMNQSSLPAFLSVMKGQGEYKKADAEFVTNWGTKAYFRTGKDPDSIVGITNVRHIWGDEAGLYSLYFWENIQARAAFREAPITLTTSPYTLNWIFKEMIRPKMKGHELPDVDLIQAASIENPFFPKAFYERSKARMDPRRFNAMFGGKWEKMEGLVYDCFDEVENQCAPFALPAGTKIIGGIDWGHTEPFCLTIRAVTPNNYQFQISETYLGGRSIFQIMDIVKAKHSVFKFDKIYCGPDRPENILALCEAKLPAVKADNSIMLGIERHYELIKTRRYKVFEGTSPHTLDEIEMYHYPSPEDVGPDDNVKNVLPVQQNDHAMDSNRYISIHTFKGVEKHVPGVRDETPKKVDQFKRLELLKKKKKPSKAEVWS